MKVRMTPREFELLLLINNIWEFEKFNPGSIPKRGIIEIIVDNEMEISTRDEKYGSVEYRDCLHGLKRERLVNRKTKITRKGKKFLIEAYAAAETICKAKNIDNILNDNEKAALLFAREAKEKREEKLKFIASTTGAFFGPIAAEILTKKKTLI